MKAKEIKLFSNVGNYKVLAIGGNKVLLVHNITGVAKWVAINRIQQKISKKNLSKM